VWRYLLISTAIVFLIGGALAAVHFTHPELRVASVQSTGSPSPPRREAASTFTPGPIEGNAPWVFNTLLDCFRHERTFEGTLDSVRRHIPADAKPLQSYELLQSGNCRAVIESDDSARVQRESNSAPSVSAVVPPHVEVFTQGGPANPADFGKRRIYVLRWKTAQDARLDRLESMDFTRVVRVRV
jgi:hypothetical protein